MDDGNRESLVGETQSLLRQRIQQDRRKAFRHATRKMSGKETLVGEVVQTYT